MLLSSQRDKRLFRIIYALKKLGAYFFCIFHGRAVGQALSGREEWKVKSEKKWLLRTEWKNILYRRDRACPCPQQITYKIKSTDNRKGCLYGCANILISYQPKLSYINNNLTAAASHRPTTSSFAPYSYQLLRIVRTGASPVRNLYQIQFVFPPHLWGRDNENLLFIAFSPSVSLRSTAIALLRYPDFVYAAWSAAQNRPLRQQMFPLSATGGGRICCPTRERIYLYSFAAVRQRLPCKGSCRFFETKKWLRDFYKIL